MSLRFTVVVVDWSPSFSLHRRAKRATYSTNHVLASRNMNSSASTMSAANMPTAPRTARGHALRRDGPPGDRAAEETRAPMSATTCAPNPMSLVRLDMRMPPAPIAGHVLGHGGVLARLLRLAQIATLELERGVARRAPRRVQRESPAAHEVLEVRPRDVPGVSERDRDVAQEAERDRLRVHDVCRRGDAPQRVPRRRRLTHARPSAPITAFVAIPGGDPHAPCEVRGVGASRNSRDARAESPRRWRSTEHVEEDGGGRGSRAHRRQNTQPFPRAYDPSVVLAFVKSPTCVPVVHRRGATRRTARDASLALRGALTSQP